MGALKQRCFIAAQALFFLTALSACGDDEKCCPRDDSPNSSCVRLGGPTRDGCGPTCDFWCSTNWRVERDDNGCEVWKYDQRAPASGENLMCRPDAGTDSAQGDDAGEGS